jgi:hypothetical protein
MDLPGRNTVSSAVAFVPLPPPPAGTPMTGHGAKGGAHNGKKKKRSARERTKFAAPARLDVHYERVILETA